MRADISFQPAEGLNARYLLGLCLFSTLSRLLEQLAEREKMPIEVALGIIVTDPRT